MARLDLLEWSYLFQVHESGDFCASTPFYFDVLDLVNFMFTALHLFAPHPTFTIVSSFHPHVLLMCLINPQIELVLCWMTAQNNLK